MIGLKSCAWRVVLSGSMALGFSASTSSASAQALLTGDGRYPRVVKLPDGELIASVLTFPEDDEVSIFSSKDSGGKFRKIGAIRDPEFQNLKSSSPSLFRLPKAVGSLAAGTLILGIVVDTAHNNPNSRARIKIYTSDKNGRKWRFVSIAVQSPNGKDLWEPDFSIAADGALVMHYADESADCCSQKLVKLRSYDGITWQDQADTVALPDAKLRPGMPVVARLRDGRMLMTYEICGMAKPLHCATYYKTSLDGWNYGPPETPGIQMKHGSGSFFAHTPVVTVMPDGALIWMGQSFKVPSGAVAPNSGQVMLKSPSGNPAGPWITIRAPFPLYNAVAGSGCEGFSPGLAPVGADRIVHVTSRTDGRLCNLYFAVGPVN